MLRNSDVAVPTPVAIGTDNVSHAFCWQARQHLSKDKEPPLRSGSCRARPAVNMSGTVVLNLRIPSSTHTLSYQFQKSMTIREMKQVLLDETKQGAGLVLAGALEQPYLRQLFPPCCAANPTRPRPTMHPTMRARAQLLHLPTVPHHPGAGLSRVAVAQMRLGTASLCSP